MRLDCWIGGVMEWWGLLDAGASTLDLQKLNTDH